MAASETAAITAPVADRSALPAPLVSLKSQGDANNTAASNRLYRSSTDSRRHFDIFISSHRMGFWQTRQGRASSDKCSRIRLLAERSRHGVSAHQNAGPAVKLNGCTAS